MMELEGMWQTCPNHRHHGVCIISARVSIAVRFLSSAFKRWSVNLEDALEAFDLEYL